MIQFQSIEVIDKDKYKLSGITRGQQGTNEYVHTAGEKFILLDDSIVSFEMIPGKKFFLKAVTYGDSLENTKAKMFEL